MLDIGDLLAVDPSIVSPGAALFRDGRLIAAARVRVRVDTSLNASERCMAAATVVIQWLNSVPAAPIAFAHEWPQVYAAGKTRSDPNDLPYMVGVSLAIVAALQIRAQVRGIEFRVLCFSPAEWIGQLPKSRTSALASPRGRRIASRLDASELALLPDQHDAIDAVGIGLHALGRLGVRRVLSSI